MIAEPKAAHGFDPVWRLSFILFSQVILLWLMVVMMMMPDSIWRVSFSHVFVVSIMEMK